MKGYLILILLGIVEIIGFCVVVFVFAVTILCPFMVVFYTKSYWGLALLIIPVLLFLGIRWIIYGDKKLNNK